MDVRRCQRRVGLPGQVVLPTPAGLAPLSGGNEPSLGSQSTEWFGLEETSLQLGPRDAMPHPARMGSLRLSQEQTMGQGAWEGTAMAGPG